MPASTPAPPLPAALVPDDAPVLVRPAADAARDGGSGRDWETVLFVLFVLFLAVAVIRLDAMRGAWAALFATPAQWGQRYTFFAQLGFARNGLGAVVPPAWASGETTAGLAGLMTLAAPALLWIAYVVLVLWAAAGLMAGPRLRRPAVLLVSLALAALAAELVAHFYLTARLAELNPGQGQAVTWAFGGSPTLGLGGRFEYPRGATDVTGYLFQALPLVALLAVMTRPGVRDLFDRRVRKRRNG